MNFKPKIEELDNNLRLVTLSMPQSQSVTVLLMVKVGSRYEADKIAGISHFLEHMVFKGTKKYPSALSLSSAVDAVGAEFNAFTSKEITGFYVKSAVNHLPLALDILSQLVLQPLLKKEDINKEKGVIVEEINMREDTPLIKIADDFETVLYSKSYLGRPTIGNKKAVLNLKQKNFLNYIRLWYQPENMVLGIVGGFKKTEDLKKKINSFFKKKLKTDSFKKDSFNTFKFYQKQPQLLLKYKKTQQAHLCLGVRTFARGHKDRYVLAVLSTILGGNMSSKLFSEVREKRGLAYYIKSSTNVYLDNGYLVVQSGTDLEKIYKTVKVILKVIGSSTIYNKQELNRAKEYLKGKLALGLEDSKDICSFFVEDLLMEDKVRTPKVIVKGINQVSLSDLKRVAKSIFVNKSLNLAVIGPYKNQDKDKFKNILKL